MVGHIKDWWSRGYSRSVVEGIFKVGGKGDIQRQWQKENSRSLGE